MIYRLALIGSPVYHSMSPDIYAEIFKENYSDGEFSVFEITDASEIKDIVKKHSLNAFAVTMPYKKSIIPLLDGMDEYAAYLHAANFVTVERGKLIGHNTDGAGFLRGLEINGIDTIGKRALIHGCGGAAAAVCMALKTNGAFVSVCGRNDEHVNAFCRQNEVTPDKLDNSGMYDIFINATPLGMKGFSDYDSFSFLDSAKDGFTVCDLCYSPKVTALLKAAKDHGFTAINGIPMLREQAKAAFSMLIKV